MNNEIENAKIHKAIQSAKVNDDQKSDVSIVQLVSFYLDEVEYGVDILSVHDILRLPDITRLPNTPGFIRGVINLRGNVIPVVDGRERFGFPSAEFTEQTRIIVIATNEKQVGLLVDNVHQVVRIPETHVDPPSEMIAGISEEFISGIGRLTDRLIVILNMTNLIFYEEDEQTVEATL